MPDNPALHACVCGNNPPPSSTPNSTPNPNPKDRRSQIVLTLILTLITATGLVSQNLDLTVPLTLTLTLTLTPPSVTVHTERTNALLPSQPPQLLQYPPFLLCGPSSTCCA